MSPVIYIGGAVGVVIDGLSQGLHTQCNLALYVHPVIYI